MKKKSYKKEGKKSPCWSATKGKQVQRSIVRVAA